MGKRCFVFVVVLVALSPLIGTPAALCQEKEEDTIRVQTLKQVEHIIQEKDPYAALEFLNGLGEPEIVAQRYKELVDDFYWKENRLPEVIFFGQAGIQYCFVKALDAGNENLELAQSLRGTAKAISYNIASYTWPGWGEPERMATLSDLDWGFDAAKMNLRLARELEKPPIKLSIAHWMLGACHLAAGRYDEAVGAFTLAKTKAIEAEDKPNEMLAIGYVGVAKLVADPQDKKARETFDKVIATFKEEQPEYWEFYIEQLETALKVFAD